MNRWLLLVCVAFAGCDYTVPLVNTPSLDIDNAVVGLWQQAKDGGQTENLLVLPLGKQEYLVSYPAGGKDAMFARGCLWRSADRTFVQLNWFGTAQGKLPEDSRTFQFATYKLEGDTLRVRLLNAEVVDRDAKSADALLQAIAANQGKSGQFRDEMVFKKVKD